MGIRAVLVDDEFHTIQLFQQLLNLFENDCTIVGTANNLTDGVAMVRAQKPDVVFMDIEMPNHSGLEVRKLLDVSHVVKLVYVTAHSQYALDAWRVQAFDYLLKPLKIDELRMCLERIGQSKGMMHTSMSVGQEKREAKIPIHSQQGTIYLEFDEVNFIEASSMYSIVHTDTDQIVVSKPLREFEYLCEGGFYRVHRSYMVNTAKIKKFIRVQGNEVELKNGISIPVSQGKIEQFKHFMQQQFGLRSI